MAAATIYSASDYSSFFKNRFPQVKIEDLVKYDKPTLSAIKKSDELEGNITYVPVKFDAPQGISASLTHALGNVSSSVGTAWQLTTQAGYAGLTIDAQTMLKSRSSEGAYFKAREDEFAGILEQVGQRFEQMLWRDGTGSIGQVSSAVTATSAAVTITLTDSDHAINFHKNMKLYAYDNDGTGGAPSTIRTTTAMTVSGVNEDTGVITVTSVPVSLVASDHLVRPGDLNAFVKGIPAWIPSADPSASDSFFGVNRSKFPQRLAGHRQSWLGTIEETVKRLAARIRRINQNPMTLWLSYANFNRLDIELGARGIRTEDGKGAVFGRPSLSMATPSGVVSVKCSPYLDDNDAYLLDMSSWKLCHLGGLPHLVQDDGLTATRIGGGVAANAVDGIEIRVRYFMQLLCMRPYANGRATIS